LGRDEIRQKKPEVYQEIAGKRNPVRGAWVLRGTECSFQIGAYDRGLPLVIDPPIAYSTYLGGNGGDYVFAVATDGSGNTYVTGQTGSNNFPLSNGAYQTALQGVDAFVTKFNARGTARVYSTYLGGGTGGTGLDQAFGIAVDSQGNAYVTGTTDSS